MPYFKDNYSHIKYPIGDTGLRNAQIGAIHSIASYFTLGTSKPAIIVMPTGSGKTVVLMMSPFILRVERLLVITPSRLVREQIIREFSQLNKLKELGVLGYDIPNPISKEITSQITSTNDWQNLTNYNVVVGSPNSLSPAYENIPEPPMDLFDLVIFDEAHHLPAKTWTMIHKVFEKSKQIFFTATPYRRDNKKIIGKNIYNYPLHLAMKDKIFGTIRFEPVDAAGNGDVEIAQKVEEVFNEDVRNGFNNKVLVRTDSKKRAKELSQIYLTNTALRLKVIHSDLSLKYVQKWIQCLRTGELDGIICVNMFGEGFDFPELKIAGIHSPHKSLEVTLQFIGRFARTNGGRENVAKFISTTHDIKLEGTKLYDENVNWQKMIVNLNDYKLFQEQYEKETFEKLEEPQIANEKFNELSPSSLLPFFHIQIFKLSNDININESLKLKEEMIVEYKNVSQESNFAVYIISEIKDIKWIKQESYRHIVYDLIVIYYDPESRFLIINSSKKDKILYEKIIKSFTSANYKKISSKEVNRVFNDYDSFIVFNLGLNKKSSASSESYKIIVGKDPSTSITNTDGNVYDSGHAMAKVVKGSISGTIGASKNGKIWSNTIDNIPRFIKWIEFNVNKIKTSTVINTGSRFDIIKPTEIINTIPTNIILIDWNKHFYLKNYLIKPIIEGDNNIDLLNTELELELPYNSNTTLNLNISLPGKQVRYSFKIDRTNLFEKIDDNIEDFIVTNSIRDISMLELLNNYPLKFFTNDFKSIEGQELSSYNPIYSDIESNCTIIDWNANNVDILEEITTNMPGKISIHDFLKVNLLNDNEVLIYDHGTQEIADFVGIQDLGSEVLIRLYHCKGSTSVNPGSRVDDMYEVIGQGIKSMNWIISIDNFMKKIEQRTVGRIYKYLKGDRNLLNDRLQYQMFKEFKFEICLVQPGLSLRALKNNIALPINAATDFFRSNNGILFKLYCSA